MKLTLTLVMMWSFASFAQCTDIYGKRVNCPNAEDSLIIYNNTSRVYDYYDKNTAYTKINTYEVQNASDKKEVFDKLQKARKMFFVIRREVSKLSIDDKKANPGKPIQELEYKDVSFNDYFQEVDEYRFYQRELENQIINLEAPMPIYDNRIAPIVVNEYKCLDSTSMYYGDIVNIPLYIPVVIKPAVMLTLKELEERNEWLHIKSIKKINKPKTEEATMAIKPKATDEITGRPVYLYNEYGSGSIIGFMYKRKFRKIRPEEYKDFVVLKYAQKFLENDEKVAQWIRVQYGDYCIVFN